MTILDVCALNIHASVHHCRACTCFWSARLDMQWSENVHREYKALPATNSIRLRSEYVATVFFLCVFVRVYACVLACVYVCACVCMCVRVCVSVTGRAYCSSNRGSIHHRVVCSISGRPQSQVRTTRVKFNNITMWNAHIVSD